MFSLDATRWVRQPWRIPTSRSQGRGGLVVEVFSSEPQVVESSAAETVGAGAERALLDAGSGAPVPAETSSCPMQA